MSNLDQSQLQDIISILSTQQYSQINLLNFNVYTKSWTSLQITYFGILLNILLGNFGADYLLDTAAGLIVDQTKVARNILYTINLIHITTDQVLTATKLFLDPLSIPVSIRNTTGTVTADNLYLTNTFVQSLSAFLGNLPKDLNSLVNSMNIIGITLGLYPEEMQFLTRPVQNYLNANNGVSQAVGLNSIAQEFSLIYSSIFCLSHATSIYEIIGLIRLNTSIAQIVQCIYFSLYPNSNNWHLAYRYVLNNPNAQNLFGLLFNSNPAIQNLVAQLFAQDFTANTLPDAQIAKEFQIMFDAFDGLPDLIALNLLTTNLPNSFDFSNVALGNYLQSIVNQTNLRVADFLPAILTFLANALQVTQAGSRKFLYLPSSMQYLQPMIQYLFVQNISLLDILSTHLNNLCGNILNSIRTILMQQIIIDISYIEIWYNGYKTSCPILFSSAPATLGGSNIGSNIVTYIQTIQSSIILSSQTNILQNTWRIMAQIINLMNLGSFSLNPLIFQLPINSGSILNVNMMQISSILYNVINNLTNQFQLNLTQAQLDLIQFHCAEIAALISYTITPQYCTRAIAYNLLSFIQTLRGLSTNCQDEIRALSNILINTSLNPVQEILLLNTIWIALSNISAPNSYPVTMLTNLFAELNPNNSTVENFNADQINWIQQNLSVVQDYLQKVWAVNASYKLNPDSRYALASMLSYYIDNLCTIQISAPTTNNFSIYSIGIFVVSGLAALALGYILVKLFK